MPFEGGDTLLCAEDLLLVFLELGEDVSLGISQGLLARPVLGHLIFVGGAYLDVVAEDIIIGHLERRDARAFALASLELKQVVLAVGREATQLIQLTAHAWSDGRATTKGGWWLFGQRPFDVGDEVAHRLQTAGDALQLGRRAGGEKHTYLLHLGERRGELTHFTWGDTPDNGFGGHTLEVADTDE